MIRLQKILKLLMVFIIIISNVTLSFAEEVNKTDDFKIADDEITTSGSSIKSSEDVLDIINENLSDGEDYITYEGINSQNDNDKISLAGISENYKPNDYVPEQTDLKENSWRYVNGENILQNKDNDIDLASAGAWSKSGGVCYNDQGQVINGATMKGIDVSKHQGTINWNQVKNTDVDYAIIRCGYGDNYTSQDDSQWTANANACTSLNIPFGVYIYSYALNTSQARSEAEHVLRLVKGYKLSFPIYLDLEDNTQSKLSAGEIGNIAKTFCDTIQNAGYEVGIYANKYWWTSKLTSSVFNNSSWHKWVAQYNSTCTYAGNYEMWQATSSGKVNGISGNVDIDFYFGKALSNNISCVNLGDSFTAKIKQTSSGRLLTNDNKNADVQPSLGELSQVWSFIRQSDGSYIIKSLSDNLNLDVSNGETADGTNIWLWEDNGTDSQKWFIHGSEGSYSLVSKLDVSKVIDIIGDYYSDSDTANAYLWTNNDTPAQKFTIEKDNEAPVFVDYGITNFTKEGYTAYATLTDNFGIGRVVFGVRMGNGEWSWFDSTYNIGNTWYCDIRTNEKGVYMTCIDAFDVFSNSTKVYCGKYCVNFDYADLGDNFNARIMQTSSGRRLTNDCGNADVQPLSNSSNQVWNFIKQSNGSYKIVSLSDNLNLDVSNGETADGTNIGLWEDNGTASQRWFICGSGGSYTFVSELDASKVIDIVGDYYNSTDTANAYLWTNNDTSAQKFTIEKDYNAPSVIDYTVTYDANGGTSAPDSQIKDYNKDLTLSTITPTRTGYKFLGWHTSVSDTGAKVISYNPGDVYKKNENLKLYAVWEKIETVNPNDMILRTKSGSGSKGGYVDIPVELAGKSQGISCFNVILKYDNNIMYPVSYIKGSSFSDMISTLDSGADMSSYNEVKFVWDSINDKDGAGSLFTVRFKIKENVDDGKYSININNNTTMFTNSKLEDIKYRYEAGSITISDMKMGDINKDGVINGKDVVLLRQYVAGWSTAVLDSSQMAVADVTGDGVVNSKDIVKIRQFIAGWPGVIL